MRAVLLCTACAVANAGCGDGGFYFSVSLQPGGGQTIAINGQSSFQSYVWWQHFATYEDGLNVGRLPIEGFTLGVPVVLGTIGPGYCAELCTAEFCRAGLVAEETVRVLVASPILISGACTDFDGNVVTIAK